VGILDILYFLLCILLINNVLYSRIMLFISVIYVHFTWVKYIKIEKNALADKNDVKKRRNIIYIPAVSNL